MNLESTPCSDEQIQKDIAIIKKGKKKKCKICNKKKYLLRPIIVKDAFAGEALKDVKDVRLIVCLVCKNDIENGHYPGWRFIRNDVRLGNNEQRT